MFMFHGDMSYHPAYHENATHIPNYQPYQNEYAVVFSLSTFAIGDYQYYPQVFHTPTPA